MIETSRSARKVRNTCPSFSRFFNHDTRCRDCVGIVDWRIRGKGEGFMPRPEVILNVFSSLDGRITTAPGRNVVEWTASSIDGDANRLAHEFYDKLGCDSLIGGSESIMVYGRHWIELADPVPMPKAMETFVVVDGRGRINWAYTKGLIVITREDVGPTYLKQLNDKGIRYIQSGAGTNVDLSEALEGLYQCGIRRIGLTGGGVLNGAFLRAGLIDEVSIFVSPLVVGGRTTPTLFDCENAADLDDLMRLELIETAPVGGGTIWAHYHVRHP